MSQGNNDGTILGANGKPTAPVAETISPEEIEAIQKEIGEMMDNPNIKNYGMALMCGAQLSAWGEHYLFNHGNYSEAASMSVLKIIHSSMLHEDGSPVPFSELAMIDKVEEMLPWVRKKTKKHAKKADREAAAAAHEAAKADKEPKADDEITAARKKKEADDSKVS